MRKRGDWLVLYKKLSVWYRKEQAPSLRQVYEVLLTPVRVYVCIRFRETFRQVKSAGFVAFVATRLSRKFSIIFTFAPEFINIYA